MHHLLHPNPHSEPCLYHVPIDLGSFVKKSRLRTSFCLNSTGTGLISYGSFSLCGGATARARTKTFGPILRIGIIRKSPFAVLLEFRVHAIELERILRTLGGFGFINFKNVLRHAKFQPLTGKMYIAIIQEGIYDKVHILTFFKLGD
ncbi:unnamed protein product [Clonostachys rhizophaga]|uniref:Uncharacterized protein n=1 Tax=Clonostachys rhizophaga TaxID=160324 RepID=A0A9N9YMJ9_9HYPO|nr:unnamed protein product [Clonostachys rhizophaga]